MLDTGTFTDGNAARVESVPLNSGVNFDVNFGPAQHPVAERQGPDRELLETTDQGVEQIATAAGFGSANNLRTHFQRITSVTPHQYRRTFRTAESVPT